MKRVLFIESGVFGGGSFTSLIKHISALDRNAVEPVVIFFNRNEHARKLTEMDVKIFYVEDRVFTKAVSGLFYVFLNKLFMKGYWKLPVIPLLRFIHRKAIKEIIAICRKERIDVIHLNTELFRDRIGLLAGETLGIPVYAMQRSKYQKDKIAFNQRYVDFANSNVSRFLAVSEDTKRFWSEEVGLDASKFIVLHDYVKTSEKEMVFKAIPPTHIKFLCIANILPVKNHAYLIQCLQNILKKTDSELLLLGKGEDHYVDQLKTEINALKLEKHITFLGFQEDVSAHIRRSDIVLLFSRSEGLPNVILESMGLGTIMVATDVGGIPELITHEKNGFLVPLDNPRNAEQIITEVLKLSPDSQKRIRVKAKESVEKKFSEEVYKNKVAQLYG